MSHRNSSNVTMSLEDKRHYIKNLRVSAARLVPEARARLQASFDTMLAGLDDGDEAKRTAIAERAKKYGELFRKALDGDSEAKASIAKMRVERINNFLVATSNVMKFLKPVTLQADEMPYFENTTRQFVSVYYLGQDGRPRRTQPIKSFTQQSFDLKMVGTEEYEYPLWDLRTGMVADEAKANVDLADDLDRGIDTLIWPMLDALCGNFTLTGPNPKRTYYVHPSINIKNLPTSNLLVPSGNTNSTLWRKECMDAVIQYCLSWGNALPGGQMKPVTVFIPSSEMTGFLQQITLTSFGNSLVEQIMDNAWVVDYAGMKWNLQADATLDPDKGRAYIQTTLPAGEFYTKPSLDKTFDDISMALQKQNKGILSMQKPIGVGMPNAWAPNVICVQYHTARD